MNRWDTLTMSEKNQLLGIYASKGYNNLANIIAHYNSFAEGGNVDGKGDDIDNRTGKPRYRREIHDVNITSSYGNNIEGTARDTSTIGPLAFYPPKYYIGKQGNQFEENPNVTYDSWFDEHPEMIDVMTDIVGRYNNRLNNRGQQLPQLNRFYFEKLYNPEDDPIIHEAIERMLQAKWNRDVRTYNDNRTLNLWDTVEKFPAANTNYAKGGHLYQGYSEPTQQMTTKSGIPLTYFPLEQSRKQSSALYSNNQQERNVALEVAREQAAKKTRTERLVNDNGSIRDLHPDGIVEYVDPEIVAENNLSGADMWLNLAGLRGADLIFNPWVNKGLSKASTLLKNTRIASELNKSIKTTNLNRYINVGRKDLNHNTKFKLKERVVPSLESAYNESLSNRRNNPITLARSVMPESLDYITKFNYTEGSPSLGLMKYNNDNIDILSDLYGKDGITFLFNRDIAGDNDALYFIGDADTPIKQDAARILQLTPQEFENITPEQVLKGKKLLHNTINQEKLKNGLSEAIRETRNNNFGDLGSNYNEVLLDKILDYRKAKGAVLNTSNPKYIKLLEDLKIPYGNSISDLMYKGFQRGGSLGHITPYGQWQYPHQVTTIPSNNITMQGVDYPVIGISNTGDIKYMLPNMDYLFDGQYVTEYPVQ